MRFWWPRFPGTDCLISEEGFRLQEIFMSEAIEQEWRAVSARIKAIIQIPDGKTGGVNPGDRRALYYLTRWLQPNAVLEIGTHVGASTLHIAAAIQQQRTASLTTVDVVDVNDPNSFWSRAGLSKRPCDALAELGMHIHFVQSDSVGYLRHVSDKYDLIFLDGDHSVQRVVAEIPLALKRLRKNGLILLHDYFPGGVQYWREERPITGPYAAVHQLQENGLGVTVIAFGKLPWPTKRGTHFTSLAALVRRKRLGHAFSFERLTMPKGRGSRKL